MATSVPNQIGSHHRNGNDGDLDIIEEHAEEEHQNQNRDQRAVRAAGNGVQHPLDAHIAAQPPEHQRKQRGSDDDGEDHRGGACRRAHGSPQDAVTEQFDPDHRKRKE
jgi:hypothetical protein